LSPRIIIREFGFGELAVPSISVTPSNTNNGSSASASSFVACDDNNIDDVGIIDDKSPANITVTGLKDNDNNNNNSTMSRQ
jgi:hypothetical protein